MESERSVPFSPAHELRLAITVHIVVLGAAKSAARAQEAAHRRQHPASSR